MGCVLMSVVLFMLWCVLLGCRSKLLTDQPNGDKLPESVHILPSAGKSQVKGMHTVIRYVFSLSFLSFLHPLHSLSSLPPTFHPAPSPRNKETKRDDFVFFTNRLGCLIMEYALSLLPFKVTALAIALPPPHNLSLPLLTISPLPTLPPHLLLSLPPPSSSPSLPLYRT